MMKYMALKKEHHLQQTQSTKEQPLLKTDRTSKFIIGIVAGLYLVTIPFLFYAYRLVPVSLTEVSVLGLDIKAGPHGNLNYYAYYFLTKLTFLIAFIIWFLTCQYWWRWTILVPICMTIFQILGIVNTSVSYIDEFDFWYSIPIVLPVCVILFFLSKRLRFYAIGLDLKDQIENEINNA